MIATPRAAIIFSASKGAKKQKHRDLAYFPGDKLGVFLLDVFTSCEARIASFKYIKDFWQGKKYFIAKK